MFREYRRLPASLADLLPWAALAEPRVVLQKDGSLLSVWEYHGPDLDSATPSELASLSDQINRGLLGLGSGWVLHAGAVRRPVEEYPCAGEFPDVVSALLERERKEQFASQESTFVTSYYLTLVWYPPEDRTEKLMRWLVTDDTVGKGSAWRQVDQFLEATSTIADRLAALRPRFLEGAEILSYLHESVTGQRHEVRVPESACYLDALLGTSDFLAGLAPQIGDHHLGVVAVAGFPAETKAGLLDALNRLALPYRWATRYIFLDAVRAGELIEKRRMRWWQKRHSLVQLLTGRSDGPGSEQSQDRDAVAMADDAIDAKAAAASGRRGFGYYTTVIVLSAPSRQVLDEQVREVVKTVQGQGFAARLERINAVEAWRGSLPGDVASNVRQPLLSTMNLAHLLPTTSVWPGLPTNPSHYFPPRSSPLAVAATASTPFRLHLHVGDVGHTLVLGPTGAGKSTLIAFLEAQWLRYPDANVVAFDKGNSSELLAEACGGAHYELGAQGSGEGGLVLAPLSRVPGNPEERAWALEWLEQILLLAKLPVTPAHREALDGALQSLQAPQATLHALRSKVQNREIREALEPYTIGGAFGHLLDGDRDSLDVARFTVFEMSHLMERGDRFVVPVLMYLFHRIQQRLTGAPTLLVLEEAWTFLLQPAFAERIQQWLRELRKYNAAVVFVSQSLSDIDNSPMRSVLYESTPTKIFLPNASARTESVAEIYRRIGLNEREVDLLGRAVAKRDYYYTSPLGRRMFDLGLGPLALSFVGAGGREDLRRVRELAVEHGASWPLAWLEERELMRWARAWRREADARRFGHGERRSQ